MVRLLPPVFFPKMEFWTAAPELVILSDLDKPVIEILKATDAPIGHLEHIVEHRGDSRPNARGEVLPVFVQRPLRLREIVDCRAALRGLTFDQGEERGVLLLLGHLGLHDRAVFRGCYAQFLECPTVGPVPRLVEKRRGQ